MEKLDNSGLYVVRHNDFVNYEFPNGKIVICGVPGAFTPNCTHKHLTGFANKIETLTELGIQRVIFISVNDAFVMQAWNHQFGNDQIDSVADPLLVFTKQINKQVDFGDSMGMRCKRFAMLAEDQQVIKFFKKPFVENVIQELL